MAQRKPSYLSLAVDVREELDPYHWGYNAKWTHDKLTAPSPFRNDRTPSFFVRLEPFGDVPAGTWSDSGAYDEEFASGDITKLLSFLRNETREETAQYLDEKYGQSYDGSIPLLKRKLIRNKTYNAFSSDYITQAVSPYLCKRGISEEVQLSAKTGRGTHKHFTALPWYSADGRLLNVKYRATRGKAFFYEKDAAPIRRLVYGADCVEASDKPLVICEAEIDALSWRTAGVQAVAIGGVGFSDYQADILMRLPVSSFVLAGDNDKAGCRFNERVANRLSSYNLSVISHEGITGKDANEILCSLGGEQLRQLYDNAARIRQFTKLVIKP